MQDPYKEMEETFLTIADVLGKEDEGQQVLDNLNEVYAKAKEQLTASNKAGTNYVLTQAFKVQKAATFRLFTDNSIPVQI